jgi:alanyl aminopeptidase
MQTNSPALTLLMCCFFLLACSGESTPQAVEPESIAGSPSPAAVDATTFSEAPAGRLSRVVSPTHYRLELTIDPKEARFSGRVSIDLLAEGALDHFWIHGKDLAVSESWLETESGTRIETLYEQRLGSGVSLIAPVTPVGPGPMTLNLVWDAPFNTAANALFRVDRDGDAYVASQLQPIAARQIFPGFDEPGFKVPFDVTLVTPTGEVAMTNTPELSAEDLGNGFTKRVFATSRPLPTYLLAFAVGPYDLVDYGVIPPNEIRQRPLPLRAITARGQGERLEYALRNTQGLLEVLERYFGTPYPYAKLDLIAMPTSFGGAMENPGAITYDEYLLLMDDESSLSQRRAFTFVHAHELAHMWFGDLVTPEWWTDIWLNESFASWMILKESDEFWPEGAFDREVMKDALDAMKEDSLAAARQIREPVKHNEAIADAFDGITYNKGGGVLAMLERFVGEEAFRDGVRLHMERHEDGVADAADFIDSLATGSGQAEIEAAFEAFIEQPGVPLLEVSVNCTPGEPPSLDVRQGRYAPLGSSIDAEASEWLVPMCVSYEGDSGVTSECTMLREQEQRIPLESEACPSRLLPNADGAGYYRFALDESWWAGLISGVPDVPPAEALVLADSLDGAFRAGKVSAETYLAGMQALLDHDSWDVAAKAADALEGSTEILEGEEMDTARAAFIRMAKDRYARAMNETGDAAELLRSNLNRFLLVVAEDEALRAPVAERAAKSIGLGEEADLAAVAPSERETAWSIGVQDLGQPFFDRLLEFALASRDPADRSRALGALARTENPAQSARLMSLVLSGELKGTERYRVVTRRMARPATRDATYDWLLENFEEAVVQVPESFRAQAIPGLGAFHCSAEQAEAWEAFINSKADLMPGYERSLAQATESVRLCAALREAKAEELVAALAKRQGVSESSEDR